MFFFFKVVYSAHQGCIYFIQNTVILWNIITKLKITSFYLTILSEGLATRDYIKFNLMKMKNVALKTSWNKISINKYCILFQLKFFVFFKLQRFVFLCLVLFDLYDWLFFKENHCQTPLKMVHNDFLHSELLVFVD